MDIKVIRHLMRGDFALLKPLIIVVWVLLALSALQALMADPDNFGSYPMHGSNWAKRGGADTFDARAAIWHGRPWQVHVSPLAQGLLVAAGSLLAICIGYAGIRWGGARPVRRRERVTAKICLLLLVLTLPQILLITITLMKQGFAPQSVALGVLSAAAVFVPLQLAMMAFGAIHGSFGKALMGALVVLSAACVVGMFDPRAVENMLLPFGDFWADQAGPRRWLYLGSCALGLGLVLLVAQRWQKRWQAIGATTAVVVLCWLGTRKTEPYELTDSSLRSGPGVAAALELAPPPFLEFNRPSFPIMTKRGERVYSLSARFPIPDLPEGHSVFWRRSGSSELWQEGRPIASAEPITPSARPKISALCRVDERAIMATLRRQLPSMRMSGPPRHEPHRLTGNTDLGQFDLSKLEELPASGQLVTLRARMRGITYHYDIIADLELEPGGEFEHHGARGTVRWLAEDRGLPVFDVLVRMPALGVSPHLEQVHSSWGAELWRFYVFLPKTKQLFRTVGAFGGESRLLAGAAVQRRGFRIERLRLGAKAHGELDFEGAQLLVVAPTVDSIVDVDEVVPNAQLRYRRNTTNDLYGILRSQSHGVVNLEELLKERPDPGRASAAELGTWLRRSYDAGLPMENIAEYAPRHIDLFLRAAGSSLWTHSRVAILKGAVAADRAKIIAALPEGKGLAREIALRGWLDEARDEVLEAWRDISRSRELVAEVIALEEPETYPRLLQMVARGEASPDEYEAIRRLPGIDESALDQAVGTLFANFTQRRWLTSELYFVLDIPVRHGRRDALEKGLRLIREKNGSVFSIQDCLRVPEGLDSKALHQWTADLDPEDLQWDPLARRWFVANNETEPNR